MSPSELQRRVTVLVMALAQVMCVTAYGQGLDEDEPMQDVIITARRVAEPNWTVPLALTTVTTTEIERAGIRDLEDLTHAVPGLAYSYARGQGGVPVLRGTSALGTGQNQNNVATLIDGLYISNPFAIDASMLDLEEVDVLRGPQNALVGRNAFAGAVLYQPAQPTASLRMGAQVEEGRDRYSRESAFVSGPLTNSLGGRVAAMHETFDGTIRNHADAQHNLGGGDKVAVSGTLLWQRSGGAHAKLSGQWFENERDATPRFAFGDLPPILNCGRSAGSATYINYCGVAPVPNAVDISPDARGLRSQTLLGRLELEQRWSAITISSLTGFIRTQLNNPPDDWDLSSAGELIPVTLRSAPDVVTRLQRANVYYTGFAFDDQEWSEELRVFGISAGWHWLAGAYWADNSSLAHVGYSADGRSLTAAEMFSVDWPSTLTPLILLPFGNISGRNQIRSVFTTLSRALDSSFQISAELRWNSERIYSLTTFVGESPGNAQSDSWSFLTPRFTLEYKAPRDFVVYASAARGARSGGFNDSTIPAETRFDAETNWTYELGAKTGGMERRTHVTAALYWMSWSDMQLDEPSLDPDFPFPVTSNIDGVTVTGVELAVDARPARWIDLALNYAYADARFNLGTVDLGIARTCTSKICRLIAAPSGVLVPDVGGNQLPGAPRHSAAFNATFHARLMWDLRWYLRMGLYTASREFIRTDNLNWLRSQWLPSARLGVLGKNWEFALWGRNLTVGRTGFVNVAISDADVRHFIADRANGSSWGASLIYRLP